MSRRIFAFVFVLLFTLSLGCAPVPATQPAAADAAPTAEAVITASPTVSAAETPPEAEVFSVSSAGIVNGIIGDAYGKRAAQTNGGVPTRSLPLSFTDAPDGTVCVAIAMTDPDAGDWVHWLVANAPLEGLAENASLDSAAALLQGKNDFQLVGYGGPTPPSGTHTYLITVYALSEALPLEAKFSYKAFTAALEGRVLASAVLTGTYTH